MLNKKTVGVVIPSYNEESQILEVLKTMPKFVDRLVVVNDHSTDKTIVVVKRYLKSHQSGVKTLKKASSLAKNKYNLADEMKHSLIVEENKLYTPQRIVNLNPERDRIIIINHLRNGSVGAAIATGYRWCRDHQIDCTAVMAGDGQMDPAELKSICWPIVSDSGVDYVKGNRLSHRSAFFVVPKIRYFGNSILSLLTKIASGYWHVSDAQTGFTAISLKALEAIRIHQIYPSYGCPNDILVKLNIAFCTIKEIPIKPVYEIGERSKMKVGKVIPKISWLLFKSFWKRLYVKYLFRDFHPLFLLYHFAFFLLICSLPFSAQLVVSLFPNRTLENQSLIIFVFLSISGFQSLFFAMWMDMMDNERLQK